MSEHLSFDEIVNFIYSTDADKPITVHRINSHIINCETCKYMYDTIYGLYELGFEKGLIEVEKNLKKRT